MSFDRIDRIFQRMPAVGKVYKSNYGKIRRFAYSLNKRLPLVKTPLYVHWHATYDCNLVCAHCGANAGKKGEKEVNTDQICCAVREMGDLGVRRFIITGGEPLLREDIFEVFAEAKKAGIKRLTLATNGIQVDKFKEELRKADLYTVHVSIDGPEESNDSFRGRRGGFRLAWEALDYFKEIGVKERVINTLAHKGNLGELVVFLKDIVNSSATLWNIQTPLAVGRAKNNTAMCLSNEEIIFLFEFMLEARKQFPVQIAEHVGFLGPLDEFLRPRLFFCGAGRENCTILANGDVVGCQILYDPNYSMGNIKEESFKKIWQKNIGQFKLPPKPDKCNTCKYASACCGGCAALWQVGGRCFKEIWLSEELYSDSGMGG